MNKSTRLTIRMKLILTYLLVLLAPSLIIGWQTYQSASHKVEDQLMNNAAESVMAANEIINANIQSKIDAVSYFAGQISSGSVNGEAGRESAADVKARLQEYAALHPDILDIYVGTSGAKSVHASDDQQQDGYDPRKENFYVNALKQGKGTVISPAFKTVNNETAIAISGVLADGSGVIGLDLNLSALADLTNIKLGKEGYIMILDSSKKFLVHPTETIAEESSLNFVKQMFEEKQIPLIMSIRILPES